MGYRYFPIMKTAASEFRAWSELDSNIKRKISPIVELTRGRKIAGKSKAIPESEWHSTPGIFGFKRNIDRFVDLFKGQETVILDATRDDDLSCFEVEQLLSSQAAYEKWVKFNTDLLADVPGLVPTLIIAPDGNEDAAQYESNLKGQLAALQANFGKVAYRVSMQSDTEFLYDFYLLKSDLISLTKSGEFFVILDHEFIRQGTASLHSVRTSAVINQIRSIVPGARIVVNSTSFPKMVDDVSSHHYELEEYRLFEILQASTGQDIFYGDYASVNPMRNDIKGGVGWIPRIDFVSDNEQTVYYRRRRNKIGEREGAGGRTVPVYDEYGPHYIDIAKRVLADERFVDDGRSWGVRKIKETAASNIAGKAPGFWISVRMEIHLCRLAGKLA